MLRKTDKFVTANVVFLSIFFLLILHSCTYIQENIIDGFSGASKKMEQDGNSLFHQTAEHSLETGNIKVKGEVEEEGMIDLDDYYKREVFVKECTLKNNKMEFIGAYRYCGYSLFDLLHPFDVEKKNAEEFRSSIDMYVVIGNAKGETTVFSWSEIFHTNNPHQIIIATESAQIEPYKKEVDYPKGKCWKIVAANDLYAYRNIENPTSIKVVSFDKKKYPIQKGLDPNFSPEVKVILDNKEAFTIEAIDDSSIFTKYYSCFYGMGMGFHEAPYFEGPDLPSLFQDSINILNTEYLQHGLACFVGKDGYRCVYSFSELFNRTDQVFPILSIANDKNDGGYYRVFHPSDFYADRSVKGLAEIFLFTE
jgi:hypothetical protein